jgi:SAM-dependent methyltransferase
MAMENVSAGGPNAKQIEFWNSDPALKWVRYQERLDRSLTPVAARLMALARPALGERVLDIGCGCGATSFETAHLVGSEGHVTGVDVSEPMLAVARKGKADGARPEFVLADAATARLGELRFDLALSRFGVMFFSEPVAAFKNIRTSLKPGGRLAFACWQAMRASPWFSIPMQAVLSQIPPPEPPDPDAPGPFAFADVARIGAILAAAGFSGIDIRPANIPLTLAEPGPDPLEDAVRFALDMGPASRLLENASDAQRTQIREALVRALKPHISADGIVLDGAIWLVSALA